MEEKSRQQIAKFIGENLREARTEKGFSQIDVAMKFGSSKSWISDIERGEALPSILTIIKFCEAIEIDPLLFQLQCLSKIDWGQARKDHIKNMFSLN